MTIRRASASDIERLIVIRSAVRENRLGDPGSVTRADYDWFVARGLVWVAEVAGVVAGFSAGDPRDATIWALFVDPAFEGAGLGAQLLSRACADVRAAGHSGIRLYTDPGTKAARLYRKLGWQEAGLTTDGEMEFRLLAGQYRFRAVTSGDLGLLATWRLEPHVREWWGDATPDDAEDLADPRITVLIVEYDGTPFGCMQDYDVHAWEGHHFGYLPAGSRGIDQFIGEPKMIGLGHGTAFIRQRISELFAAGAPAIGTDPHPTNTRAIAAYEKAGFMVAGPEEDTEWGRVIRMEAWAPGMQ